MLGPTPRIVSWAKTLTKFVSVQVAVQAMMIASGILLVRTLSQTEYAYFTIANSMQATMNILADSGIGIGLSSIGGRVWQSPYRFGQLINTVMRLRRYLAAVAVAIVTPILVWMLVANGATYAYAGLLTLAVLIGLNYQLLTGVLMVVPRLHSQISRVQKLDLFAALSRFAILIAAYFVFLNAAVGVIAAVAGLVTQYFFLRRSMTGSIDLDAPANDEDRHTILGIVRSQSPNAVFYCMQGQLTVWLISIFGSTQNIAEIGALGRLGIIFSIISAVMASIVLPSFARCQLVDQLQRRYFQILSGFILFGLSLIALAALFPAQALWILGSKYGHLRNELLLMMVMTAFNSLVAAMWSLNSSKAWIKRSWLNIPGVIITQIILLSFLDISTLSGVLWFGILSLVPTFLLNCALTVRGISGYKQVVAASR
jgi:O-antigen/teichoic acid export membrane protein